MNPILQPLSAGFRLGVALRHAAYKRGWLKVRRLNRPAVSVGNLTVGGTGKTPLVALIAKILLKHGWKPSILTRGYGRRQGADMVVLGPGPSRIADEREAGDEPALLAQELPRVPIVVCADRYRGGLVAEEKFAADVHILDDGFQHLALARDVDIVVLDVTQEISGRRLLPAGRLRESPGALKRAHIVMLTRFDLGDPQRLESRVKQIHPGAKVFRCSTKLCQLVDHESGRPLPMEQVKAGPVSAFCGIGNPQAFFRDLRLWGFKVIAEDAFRDHHYYTEREMQSLSKKAAGAGAAALLTTTKDAVKIAPEWRIERPVVVCHIQAEVEEACDFEHVLLSSLESAKKAG